jgi:hypothetical protein
VCVCGSTDANRREKAWRSAHPMTSLLRQNEGGGGQNWARLPGYPNIICMLLKSPEKPFFSQNTVCLLKYAATAGILFFFLLKNNSLAKEKLHCFTVTEHFIVHAVM